MQINLGKFLRRIAFSMGLTLLSLYVGTPSAHAVELARAEESIFNMLDVNHDGYIDRQEAAKSPTLQKAFDRIDADLDGRLDEREFMDAFGEDK